MPDPRRLPQARQLFVALVFAGLMAARLAAQTHPDQPAARLGIVDFPTSGSAAAQAHFLRGVLWLHNFGYEDAVEAFEEAIRAEAGFTMAYWGLAMCHVQPVWGTEDLTGGRATLERLGPTPEARALRTRTGRERGYLSAVEAMFGQGDKPSRDRRFAAAMAALSASFPDDLEAAAFHALALLGTASRGDRPELEDPSGGHAHLLAGSPTQARAAGILQGVLKLNPDHPGALHYLIHALDDPAHASGALAAARAYAKLAPASSHALHMPAHIFLQLGLWADAAEADRMSFRVSNERVARRNLSPAERDYHSLTWLQYELLQLGRYRDARTTFDEIRPSVERTARPPLKNALASMTARFAIETRRWSEFAAKPDYFNLDELFALGMSAAMTGDASRAGVTRERLQEIASSDRIVQLKPIARIMEREMAALAERAAGRRDQAIAALRQAVELEHAMAPAVGMPQPPKPAHELLGELLLEAGQAREATEAFRLTLQRSPNRTLSVLGLARARARLGETDEARKQYEAFLANWASADSDLVETREAREFLAGGSAQAREPDRSAGSARWLPVTGAALAGLALAAFLFVRRRSAARPVAAAPQPMPRGRKERTQRKRR
jgi:tetratricopeptide (TPR) repeat protein